MDEILETENLKQKKGWTKKLAFFLCGQTISLFGSMLVQYAVIWYITLTTDSGIMMMISTLCGFLPQILISVFAGVWADRINRKKLIILADGMIAITTLGTAILFLTGFGPIWLLFVMMGMRSIGAGIQTPAVNALIPQIVPTEKLLKVNGINSSIQALTMILTPALAGALLTFFDLELIFFVDVLTAIIAITILLFFKIANPPNDGKKKYFDDLKHGLKYISKHKFVVKMIIYSGLLMFFITPIAFLSPLQLARLFGESEWRLAVNEMCFSSGAVLGGIIISSWGGFKNRMKTIIVSCTIFGVTTIGLGFAFSFVLFVSIVGISGIFMPFFNTPSMTLLQEKVEPAMQGRVFGIVQIMSSITMPIGMILFGPLAEVVSINILFVVTGIAMVFLAIFMSFDKRLMKEGMPFVAKKLNTQE